MQFSLLILSALVFVLPIGFKHVPNQTNRCIASVFLKQYMSVCMVVSIIVVVAIEVAVVFVVVVVVVVAVIGSLFFLVI